MNTAMKLSALSRTIFDAGDAPAAVVRQDGMLLLVNHAFAELSGWKKRHLEAVRNLDCFIPAEMVRKLVASRAIPLPKSRGKAQADAGIEIVFSDRAQKTFPLRAMVSRLPGTHFRLVILRPMHAKRAETTERDRRQFRSFFEQNDAAILVFEPQDCTVVDANLAAASLFGCSREELVARGLELFAEPNELDNLRRIICSVPSAEQSYVMTYLKQDRTKSILRFHANVIRMNGGELVYCSFKDIGEEIRLREELRFRQAQLIHANKMGALGMLVSSVAHEINNPNNFIMHNIQIITEVWKDVLPILRDYYQEHGDYYLGGIPLSEFEEVIPRLVYGIRDGSERINRIVANLREYVRSDRARIDSRVDLGKVVMNAVALMQSEVARHTASFQVMCAEGLPCIRGSAQKLEQVVINLLMNALQSLADRSRGVNVVVTHEADTDEILLMVRDEGVGMSEQVQAKILEPFFSTKLERGGTGLGLYISHSIIREHKGSMHFTSAPGKGTTVTVRIPAASSRGGSE